MALSDERLRKAINSLFDYGGIAGNADCGPNACPLPVDSK
jgi:hypothetical protein